MNQSIDLHITDENILLAKKFLNIYYNSENYNNSLNSTKHNSFKKSILLYGTDRWVLNDPSSFCLYL